MFNPDECARLQELVGRHISLDACADDTGSNKQHSRYCSPMSSFLDFDCSGEHVWLNAPFKQLCSFISHYRSCKDKAPGSTSALIVVPTMQNHPVSKLVHGMQKVAEYPVGTNLFSTVHADGTSSPLQLGIPWPIAVYYDPPRTLKQTYVASQPRHRDSSRDGVEVKCKASGADAKGTLDCGASHSFMRTAFANEHQFHVTPCSDVISLADGSTTRARGICKVRFQSGSLTSMVDCYVVDLSPQYDILLGMDFMKKNQVQISFSEENTSVVTARRGDRRVTLPKPSQAPVTLSDRPVERIMLSALQFKRAMRKGAHCFMVQIEKLDEAKPTVQIMDKSGLIPDDELHALLSEFKNSVFVDGLPTIRNPTTLDFEVIPTEPGTVPPYRKPYRLTPAERKEITERVKELLEKGMIEPSTSPYSAPILFVKKKDGVSLRMVLDYRALNSKTIKNRAPLNRISELLDSLHGVKVTSLIDLSGGYHQLGLLASDKEKTAFATPLGHFQWTVLPQGICNAPSAFQATMNRLFRHMLGKSVFIYLDDILVASKSPEEHVQHLREVLQILKEHKLYANIQKCQFNLPEVNYLGHIVGRNGIRPDPQKIQVVQNWPQPRTVHEVRSFLGLCNFFRRFIKDYSTKAAGLNRLLQKDGCKWNTAAQQSFEGLKKALVNAPVMAVPDFDKPYELEVWTDASDSAVGAVLMQDGHPIAYESRKFSSAERNYHTTDRELLAIVHALRTWRCYLEGADFTVKCDHKALSFFQNKAQFSPRQARWLEFLERFDLKIEHVPGKVNAVADALSRATHGADGPVLASIQVGKRGKRAKDRRQITPASPEWEEAIKTAISSDAWFQHKQNTKDLTEQAGIWYKGHLVVLPEALRKQCITECHDSPYSGHKGVAKTLDLLRRDYWWPGMRQDVIDYVTTCAACQRSKASNKKKAGALNPLNIPVGRWHSVSMDFITGLPCTEKGHDAVYVVLDRLTKMAHFIPCTKDTGALDTAQLFVDHVYKLHGFPLEIISDRDARFKSDFWQRLTQLLGTKHKMSTAFHPETDGGTERLNRILEEYLRSFVGPDQSDWDRWLSLAEFAYNNSKQESTGFTPFYANYGYHPRTPNTPKPMKHERTPSAVELAETMDQVVKKAKRMLEAAQQRQKAYADKSRRDVQYAVGEQVMLSTKNIKLKTPGTQKLMPKYIGPFEVLQKVGSTSYKLQLPDCMQMHPVFHVSLLEKYRKSTDGGRYQPPPPAIIFNDEEWCPIDRILKERNVGRGRGHKRKMQYLVRYTGYGAEWDQWCDEQDITEVALQEWRRSRTTAN